LARFDVWKTPIHLTAENRRVVTPRYARPCRSVFALADGAQATYALWRRRITMAPRRISARIALALFCTAVLSIGTVYAAEHEVSGTIETVESGPIFVSIYDETGFDEEVPLQALIIPADELNDGVGVFSFVGLESGAYAIRCFQDLNGNEVLDFGRFGPTEPIGFYRESTVFGRPPQFDEISFELGGDITDILISIL
jgi:uncharacterized protein (DUF2141 family)